MNTRVSVSLFLISFATVGISTVSKLALLANHFDSVWKQCDGIEEERAGKLFAANMVTFITIIVRCGSIESR